MRRKSTPANAAVTATMGSAKCLPAGMSHRHHTDDVLALAFGQNLSIWVSGVTENGAHLRTSCGC